MHFVLHSNVDIIRYAEKEYYSHHFEVKGDIRKTWRLIRSIRSNGAKKTDNIKEIKIDGAICSDNKKIADKFNEFFVNVGPSSAKQVAQAITSQCNYLVNSVKPSTSVFMSPIDPAEICSVICRLKGNKSPGYDDISSKVVKAVAQYISNPLSEVFNISLSIGEFPDKLKLAKVIPVYEADDHITHLSDKNFSSHMLYKNAY